MSTFHIVFRLQLQLNDEDVNWIWYRVYHTRGRLRVVNVYMWHVSLPRIMKNSNNELINDFILMAVCVLHEWNRKGRTHTFGKRKCVCSLECIGNVRRLHGADWWNGCVLSTSFPPSSAFLSPLKYELGRIWNFAMFYGTEKFWKFFSTWASRFFR